MQSAWQLCTQEGCLPAAVREAHRSHQALFFPDAEGKGKTAAEYIEFERKNADFDTEFSSE